MRTVATALSKERGKEVGYTTALKLLQLMHEKGLVTRDERSRSHRYSAKQSPDKMRKQMVRDFAKKVFGGDMASLAMHALSAKKATPEELDSLRQLIDEMKEKDNSI